MILRALLLKMESPRVLSVQSHVVSGYVGNKSAVFPLQLLGFEVDNINSVQFSNHTGYKKVTGQILSEKDLLDLTNGLSENEIDLYSHLLTGYIGAPSFLNQVANLVQHLRKKNPKLIYVCDPVMGDNGKLYVPPDLIEIYKQTIVPLATIITPNLFEAELLTDTKINNTCDVWRAVEILHQKGCSYVVISSADLEDKSKLEVFASMKLRPFSLLQFSYLQQRENNLFLGKKVSISIEKLPYSFTGTGDLFAALLLAWMHKTDYNLIDSLEKTIASLQSVLKRTISYLKGKPTTPRNVELKLIQSKRDIEEPKVIYKATVIER